MNPEEEKQFNSIFLAAHVGCDGYCHYVNAKPKVKDAVISLLNTRLQSIKEAVEGLRPEWQQFTDEMSPAAAYIAGQENGCLKAVDKFLAILNKQGHR